MEYQRPRFIYVLSIFLLIVLSGLDLRAQQVHYCGNEKELSTEKLVKVQEKTDADMAVFYAWQKQRKELKAPALDVTIPVHVVIIENPMQDISDPRYVSEARIRAQIEVLNECFGGTNENNIETPSEFSRGSSGIRFCLASTDPDGNPTDGITRYPTTFTYNQREDEILKETLWPTSNYLNIYVAKNLSLGLGPVAGYSPRPLPGELPDPNQDAIRIVDRYVGGKGWGNDPESLSGRVCVHEVGHWLGLAHPWGAGRGCSLDDGLTDTPPQDYSNSGCKTHPSPSCNNNGDMFMNFMDYSEGICKTTFTQDQCDFMEFIIEGTRSGLLENSDLCSSSPISLVLDSITHPPCPNEGVGRIVVSGRRGTPPYEYSLDGSAYQESGVFESVTSGNHIVDIVDATGLSDSRTIIVDNGLDDFTWDVDVISRSCPEQNIGELTLEVKGGNLGRGEFRLAQGNTEISATNVDTILNQSFENGFPYDWRRTSSWSHSLNESNASGSGFYIPYRRNFLYYNDANFGNTTNNPPANLYSNVVYLNGSDDFILEFDAYFLNSISGGVDESARILISTDRGQSYQVLDSLSYNPKWTTYTYEFEDVSFTDFIVGFRYHDGGSWGTSYGLAIDDVKVMRKLPVSFSGLSSGFYEIELTDEAGCVTDTIVQIEEPDVIDLIGVDYTPITCETGDAIVLPESVNAIREYILGSTSDSTGRFENMAEGSYALTMIDEFGCSESDTVVLDFNDELRLEVSEFNDIDCAGDTGGFSFVSYGGNGSISYFMNDTALFSTSFEDVPEGEYLVTIYDDLGCVDSLEVTFTEPSVLDLDMNVEDENCNDLGLIDLTTQGGTAPYAYSLDGVNFSEEDNFMVSADSYEVVVRDANGCESIQEVQLDLVAPQLELLSVVPVTTSVLGSVTVTTTQGLPPYTYTMLPAGITNDSGVFENLEPGEYNFLTTDANDCVDTLVVVLDLPSAAKDQEEQSKLSVYPIPSTETLNIDYQGSGQLKLLSVTNVKGERLPALMLKDDKIDISALDNGVYVLRLGLGEVVHGRRFIKI